MTWNVISDLTNRANNNNITTEISHDNEIIDNPIDISNFHAYLSDTPIKLLQNQVPQSDPVPPHAKICTYKILVSKSRIIKFYYMYNKK